MTIRSDELCQACRDVENILEINIRHLFQDLAMLKGKELTDLEKRYLCLSLCGDEPIDIARQENYQRIEREIRSNYRDLTEEEIHNLVNKRLEKKALEIRIYLSKTINFYVIMLMEKIAISKSAPPEPCEIPNIGEPVDKQKKRRAPRKSWAKIICFLKANGYKCVLVSTQEQPKQEIMEIDYKGRLLLKKLFQFLKESEQKYGLNFLSVDEIEQEGDEDEIEQEGDEDNEQE